MNSKLHLSLFSLCLPVAVACGSADPIDLGEGSSDGAEPGDGLTSGTTTGYPGSVTGTSAGTTTGTTTGSVPGDCAMMCEIEETVTVPVEGGGANCTAPAWMSGTGYVGGSTVSLDGKEYTSNYWTDASPALEAGSAAGAPWSAGTACPGGGLSTEEVTTTKMVCCDPDPVDPDPADPTDPVDPTDPTDPVAPLDPDLGCALDAHLGKSGFESWFQSRRDPFYTYENLCIALEDFPGFAASGNATQDKREIAAFFANVSRETGELDYIEQFPESRGSTGNYYGRGPIQLTWDYNYSEAGAAIGEPIHQNPDLVATDGAITWLTALWFWMDADGAGKGTCHAAIAGGSFGQTINIINGGLECNAGNAAALQRIDYYKDYCSRLGVEPGSDLDCW